MPKHGAAATPEEAQIVVVLSLLRTFTKNRFMKVEIMPLHRALTNLARSVVKLEVPGLRRLRFVFIPDGGRYPVLDQFLEKLSARKILRTEWDGECEMLYFESNAEKCLDKRFENCQVIGEEQKKILTRLSDQAVKHYQSIVSSSGCDYN